MARDRILAVIAPWLARDVSLVLPGSVREFAVPESPGTADGRLLGGKVLQ